ncbi:MAG: acyl-CoA dehydrogenase family protein [Pseudomonadota bacterium]
MAEFTLDEDQRQIQDMMHKFAQNELRAVARDCDEEADLPSEILDKTWELGLCANPIPEKYGGFELGRSIVTAAIIAEELGWGDLSLALGALSPLLLMIPVLEGGTESQKQTWLPRFTREKFFPATAALMEPRLTFNPFELHTRIKTEGDILVLNGRKIMAPLADQARHILIFAAVDDDQAKSAVQAVILDRDASGLTLGEREKNMGLNPLPLYPLEFKDCAVPQDRLIGQGQGLDYLRLINLSRTILCALAVGVARASHEYALNYARERHAFGEPLASRQAIAFMLAESAMEIEAMRLLTWKAAWRLDRGQDATREAALARMYCADEAMKITDYGVQILGGHGYIREHPVEMWFRNGRAFAVLEGLAMF